MTKKVGVERRQKPRQQDGLYRFILILNGAAWCALVVSLVLFHFARPEMVTGVQQFWGLESRSGWSPQYVSGLLLLLQACLGLSLFAMILRAKRSRRRGDQYGVNLFILAGITSASLVTLTATLS
jgi:hypothetical protein